MHNLNHPACSHILLTIATHSAYKCTHSAYNAPIPLTIAVLENDDHEHSQDCTHYEASHGEHNDHDRVVQHNNFMPIGGGGVGYEINIIIIIIYASLRILSQV